MRLSPDQLDDVLSRSSTRILYQPNTGQIELDARLALLFELNEELAKDGGQAGTHAYDMMAAVEDINAGTTAVLIELVAGVALLKSIVHLEDNIEKVRSGELVLDATHPVSITFQPSDIDDMQRAYDMDVKRDGMQVTVTLTKKAEPTESWQLDEGEDATGAREQAPAAPERPVWAIAGGCDADMHPVFKGPYASRTEAEAAFRLLPTERFRIENRYCMHWQCPSVGCVLPEVTSGA